MKEFTKIAVKCYSPYGTDTEIALLPIYFIDAQWFEQEKFVIGTEVLTTGQRVFYATRLDENGDVEEEVMSFVSPLDLHTDILKSLRETAEELRLSRHQ